MKKIFITFLALILISFKINAQESVDLSEAIKEIQYQWAIVKYKSKNDEERVEGFRQCAKESENLVNKFPKSAEALIWQGICLSSEAEIKKITALGKIKEAKKIFEKATKIDEKALNASAYTNLAVLYHRVPVWPIAFGDNQKAEKYFSKALSIAPNDIDLNYFYALFLEDEKDDYKSAIKYLNIALNAPSRNRPLADEMRKKEILQKIKEFSNEIE